MYVCVKDVEINDRYHFEIAALSSRLYDTLKWHNRRYGETSRGYKCMRGRNEDAADVHHTLDAIAHYATQRKARRGRGRDN